MGFLLAFLAIASAQGQTLLYEDFGPVIYSNGTVNGAALGMYDPIGFGAGHAGSISTVNVPAGETQTLQEDVTFTQTFSTFAANTGYWQIQVASQYAPGGQAGGGTVVPVDASSYTIGAGSLSIELYASVTTTFDIFVGDNQNHLPPSGPWTHETAYTTPMTIPAGVWTNVILPLDSNAGHWDTNFSTVDWTHITQVFIDAQAPPCLAVFTAPGTTYPETINYGTIQFIQSPAGPTPTPVNTPVYQCVTSTFTDTPTVTNTPTITNTPTDTATPTNTFTETMTPTSGVYFQKKASEDQANGGDIITYTIAVTVTSMMLNGPVISDTLPSNLTFIDFGHMVSGTVTMYNQSTGQLSWNIPGPLGPGGYLFTYDAQVSNTLPCQPIVNNAQMNYQGLASPLSSSVTAKMSCDYTVRVGVYNSAGELVKQLSSVQLPQAVGNVTFQPGNSITSVNGPNSQLKLYDSNYLLGTWDGNNSSGNPVSNGEYHLKIDSIDSRGTITSVIQQVVVTRPVAKVYASIFDSAGETVRHLYALTSDPAGVELSTVSLDSSVLRPGPVTGTGQPSNVQIIVATSSVPVTLFWDGTNDSGGYVTPGHYQLGVHWTDGQGNTSNIIRSILVTGATGTGVVTAAPNVLSKGTFTTVFSSNSLQAETLRIKIYTAMGELVDSLEGAPNTNQAAWNASNFASGLYIAHVELLAAGGGVVGRQDVKVVLMH